MTSEDLGSIELPIITDINPEEVAADDELTITGHHLASVTVVTFTVGDTSKQVPKSDFKQQTPTRIVVAVPAGLPTGNGKLTVTNPAGPSNPVDITIYEK